MESYSKKFGLKGHLTSLKPLSPSNAPDEWEKKALSSFDSGIQEVKEFTQINERPYLRLMRPLTTKESCLKCHKDQGYKEGDIRGGIGIAVPAQTFFDKAHTEILSRAAVIGLLWIIGLVVITMATTIILDKIRKQKLLQEKLSESDLLFTQISENINDAFWVIELDDNKSFDIRYISPAFEKYGG